MEILNSIPTRLRGLLVACTLSLPLVGGVLAAETLTHAAAGKKHEHPALPGVLSLDVSASGNSVQVLCAELATETPTLQFSRSKDGGETWTLPVRVDEGARPAFRPHRGMDPQVASAGDRVIAVWMTRGTGLFESGPMATAISDDGGRSWQPGPNPADDRSTGGHSFLDLSADEQGTFHLVWLDSRDGKQGLRYAQSTDGGRSWTPNTTLKTNTCECCWNSVVVEPRGRVHVMFRDLAPRDLRVITSGDRGQTWREPVTAGRFNWEFNGCPHVGGGLATVETSRGPVLHAVSWTGATGKSGVHHLRSEDGGRTWSEPLRLCGGDGRRGDIAALDGGRIAAAWEHSSEGVAFIAVSTSADGGQTWSPAKSLSTPGVAAAYPRVVAVRNGFRVFWTETTASLGRWRMEKIAP